KDKISNALFQTLIDGAPDYAMNGSTIGSLLEEFLKQPSLEDSLYIYGQYATEILKETILYLDISYDGLKITKSRLDKIKKKDTLATILCQRLKAYIVNECNICSSNYIPIEEPQTKTICRICGVAVHGCNDGTIQLWVCRDCTLPLSPAYFKCLEGSPELPSCSCKLPNHATQCQPTNCNTPSFPPLGGSSSSQEESSSLSSPQPPLDELSHSASKPSCSSAKTTSATIPSTKSVTTAAPSAKNISKTKRKSKTAPTAKATPDTSNVSPAKTPPSNTTIPSAKTISTTTTIPSVNGATADSIAPSNGTIEYVASATVALNAVRADTEATTPSSDGNDTHAGATTSAGTAASNTTLPVPILCPELAEGTCRYGLTGKRRGKCPKLHPEMCLKFLHHGATKNGCNKKDSCPQYHPPYFCSNSVNYLECYAKKCEYRHHQNCHRTPPTRRDLQRNAKNGSGAKNFNSGRNRATAQQERENMRTTSHQIWRSLPPQEKTYQIENLLSQMRNLTAVMENLLR
ncbi:MAG: hypothetical protein AAFW00_28390, partial [Bacteroidota bacterium]